MLNHFRCATLPVLAVFCLATFACWSQSALAQKTMTYYRATVPVKSQDTNERNRAAAAALVKVLQRMSGTQNVASVPEIADKLAKALSYVEQYQYQSLSSSDLAREGFREQLSLSFAPEVIRNLLAQAQLPFWSDNRPVTLVWLVEDHPSQGKQLLNKQSSHDILAGVQAAAQTRGLPLIFPALDMDDRLAIGPEDVWRGDEARIASASERYKADVILVGRFSQTSRGQILSIWQFFHAGSSLSYDARVDADEKNKAQALGEAALFPLADFLAARYALQPKMEASDRIVLRLSGVKNYASYRRSMNYLEGLAAVRGIAISAVRQDTLLLYLNSDADVEKLMSVFALDNKLRRIKPETQPGPVWQQMPEGTVDNPMHYRWAS